MAGRIVVGFDGTRLGRAAVAEAIRLAAADGAEVVIVCLHARPIDFGLHPDTGAQIEPGTWPREWAQKKTGEMEHEALRVRLAGLDSRPTCSATEPERLLLDVAREVGAMSIVVADDRRGGLWDRVFGSVVGHLLKSSEIPVVIVSREPSFG